MNLDLTTPKVAFSLQPAARQLLASCRPDLEDQRRRLEALLPPPREQLGGGGNDDSDDEGASADDDWEGGDQGSRRGRGGRSKKRQRELNVMLRERLQAAKRDKDARARFTARRVLPAWRQRQAVLSAVGKSRVTLVTGETGCGKSTQVPQFILDEAAAAGRGGAVHIVITQPRVLTATALARRVAQERGEAVGGVVGFSVGGARKVVGPDTCLRFVTPGLLLRWLGVAHDLAGVTHVIVDEVHERGIQVGG
ncbi:Putative ATP-dependent RNA helicase DHX57 [Monoraphidium neglectum]|uniref:Putative ATP-dependent RNA helicase DHX57 n=1 Tax=Monoraphidium neglectum TaxID=145388 RepID=A0A0D2NTC6_9CHLO|nr:Putative ATP-dependent RNA helicase DHX57 [Monoraphidium neglectum]KIZ07446.1 Putative ATP-dependent RNA helicase DHX57 [Monoraphidium neglectum]|eukprot:XP_013906465.1 Putative ATP-dependent RNA helicase DHX57 [Monoraphidium neglectum]